MVACQLLQRLQHIIYYYQPIAILGLPCSIAQFIYHRIAGPFLQRFGCEGVGVKPIALKGKKHALRAYAAGIGSYAAAL